MQITGCLGGQVWGQALHPAPGPAAAGAARPTSGMHASGRETRGECCWPTRRGAMVHQSAPAVAGRHVPADVARQNVSGPEQCPTTSDQPPGQVAYYKRILSEFL